MTDTPPPQRDTLTEHRLYLSRDLLDDIELSRLAIDSVLLKASRLARLMGSAEVQGWVSLELRGYYAPFSPVAHKYAGLTGRLRDSTKMMGHWQPLAAISGTVRTRELQIAALKLPDVNFAPSSANPNEYVAGFLGQHVQAATAPVTQAMNQMASITNELAVLREITSKVTALLHDFISNAYYELAFRGLAESIFEGHKRRIDAMLAETAGQVLQKIPAIVDRLPSGDPEAVSQAMTTCRRVLEAFADAVQPPQEEKVKVGDEVWEMGHGKYMNRLRYYIHRNSQSAPRRDRLRHAVNGLNDRFNAGTHEDVTGEEAQSLFVILYVTLGELLACREKPAEGAAPK